MQFKKEYLKNQVRKIAKQTWAGPGKFGVLIFLCILIIAFFESVGLTNRENVIEMRNVQKTVIPIRDIDTDTSLESRIQKIDTDEFKELLQKYDHLYMEQKGILRDSILQNAMIDQYFYVNAEKINATIDEDASIDEKRAIYINGLKKEFKLMPTEEDTNEVVSKVIERVFGDSYFSGSDYFSDIWNVIDVHLYEI